MSSRLILTTDTQTLEIGRATPSQIADTFKMWEMAIEKKKPTTIMYNTPVNQDGLMDMSNAAAIDLSKVIIIRVEEE